MLWLLLALVVVGAFIWWVNRDTGLDVNSDGKIDHKDAVSALDNAVNKVKSTVDLNKDGKVDAADAVAAVEGVKAKGRAAKTAVAKKVKSVGKRSKKS